MRITVEGHVSFSAPSAATLWRNAAGLSGRLLPLLALALAAGAAGLLLAEGAARLMLLSFGATFAVLVVLIRLAEHRGRRRRDRALQQLQSLVAEDAAPCFTTSDDGEILFRNRAAETRFGRGGGQSLAVALGDVFAHPSAVLYRLQSRAAGLGAAREDVVTRRGHIRLSVHRAGDGGFLWRLEEMLDRSGPARGAEGISLPMLVAGRSGAILFMNEAMRRLAGGRPRTLGRLFTDTALRNGDQTVVSTPEGPVRALVGEIEGAGGRREIYLLPLPGSARATPADEIEDLPVALLRTSRTGAIRAANRRAREMTGLAPDTPAMLSDLVEGPGRSLRDWLADTLSGRAPGRAEVLRVRRADAELFVRMSLSPAPGGDGLIAVLSDATAQKTLEAQFVQSQKMQAIGQLAGGVAHDFNNLLTAISGHCDLLLLRHDRDDPDYADLVQIHQNANRAAALVGQLLAFSRKQTLKPERIDLGEALADLTHLLNRLVGERVGLELTPAPDIDPIRADRRQFEQVLMNLVVNARDAMPEGGTIRVRTERLVLAEDLTRGRATVPAGAYALVQVVDSGTGIPAEVQEKIFEPFYTTKRAGEGTGLGLSTVYGIVKQSGGFVFLDSAPGEGSTFSLYFPALTGEDEPAPPPDATRPEPAGPTPAQGRGVVLLVEDEAPVRAFASRALRLRGYTVIEAENAEDALRALEDPALSVDVFVTDVVMPGMDGPSWVRQALEDRPGVRVIFVSGYAESDFADTQSQIPNSVFLPKPFSLDDLASTVQRQIH